MFIFRGDIKKVIGQRIYDAANWAGSALEQAAQDEYEPRRPSDKAVAAKVALNKTAPQQH